MTEEKTRSCRPPNPPAIIDERYWGVLRRAMIRSFWVWAWSYRIRAGAQRKTAELFPSSTNPRGFRTTVCARAWPYDHGFFVYLGEGAGYLREAFLFLATRAPVCGRQEKTKKH